MGDSDSGIWVGTGTGSKFYQPESEPCKYFKVESESESESECKGGIGIGAGTIRNRPSLDRWAHTNVKLHC